MLVLGGTGWLGREVARAAVSGGSEVVCLARGDSGAVAPGARLVRADRTRPGAYAEVADGRRWDEVIELAYQPELVTSALTALGEHASHWTLVSSISVYARTDRPGADETAELVTPRDLAEYADAKVAAELVSSERLDGRLLIARPGLIVGPGDPSDRFGYWPARFRRGGRLLAPETAGRHVQVVDVADLAEWLERAGRERLVGVVDAVGAAHPMEDIFAAVRATTGFAGDVVTADDRTLRANDVRYWAGPRSLPLWLPISDAGFARRDGSAFLRTGGRPRPVVETIARSLEDELRRGVDRQRRAGLTAAEETEILRALR
ncbi:SDR family oxidoreductase [Microbacterium marinilacus]|uniref:SDR family oxidoreductase n=1 Tax=Microbacterium marinilacus TaxID=415209 RepID=A0ABP7BFG2_9MICO